MKKIPYWQLLLDPRWQKKRLEILDRDNFKCSQCDDTKSTLHVHHRYYVAGRMPWDYPGFCLQTLCESCHASEQEESVTHPEFWETILHLSAGESDEMSHNFFAAIEDLWCHWQVSGTEFNTRLVAILKAAKEAK